MVFSSFGYFLHTQDGSSLHFTILTRDTLGPKKSYKNIYSLIPLDPTSLAYYYGSPHTYDACLYSYPFTLVLLYIPTVASVRYTHTLPLPLLPPPPSLRPSPSLPASIPCSSWPRCLLSIFGSRPPYFLCQMLQLGVEAAASAIRLCICLRRCGNKDFGIERSIYVITASNSLIKVQIFVIVNTFVGYMILPTAQRLTTMNGTSTSSPSSSETMTSTIRCFAWGGRGFLLTCSTSLLNFMGKRSSLYGNWWVLRKRLFEFNSPSSFRRTSSKAYSHPGWPLKHLVCVLSGTIRQCPSTSGRSWTWNGPKASTQ